MADTDITTNTPSLGEDDVVEPQILEDATAQDLPEGYEIVATEAVEPEVDQPEQMGEELLSIKNLIQRYAMQMEEIQDKIKEYKEALTNLMDNDEELQQIEEKAKTMAQDLKAKKQRVRETPESVQWQMKVKETQEELGEVRDALNNYLLRYYQITGSRVIEDDNGIERSISISARLSRKKPSIDD